MMQLADWSLIPDLRLGVSEARVYFRGRCLGILLAVSVQE